MKILVTGNGFDISKGLPTRYLDFINTLNLLNKTQSKNINGNYNTYFSVHENFRSLVDTEFYEINKILNLKDRLSNVWYFYFSDQLEIDTWIDFESKLESTLIKLENQGNYIKTKIFDTDHDSNLMFDTYTHLGTNSNNRQLLETFKLISMHPDYDGDTFVLNREYCKFNRKAESYCEFNEDAFFTFLIAEWNKFIQLFNDYIEVFVNPLIEKIEVDDLIVVDKHFTFNYTNTYNKVLHPNLKTNHLHGKISNNNSLVLGFDHFGYKKISKNIIPFTKGFQRMNKESDFRFIKYIDRHFNDITIYFLGHSLDISDKKYLDEVIDLIKGNIANKKGKLKIFYHSSKSQLLNNLCNIYGIDSIESLISEDKITFLKFDNEIFRNELKHISSKRMIDIIPTR